MKKEEKQPFFERRDVVGVAYLKSEEILLLSIPLHLIDELCEQLGEDSDLSRAIRQQTKAPAQFDA